MGSCIQWSSFRCIPSEVLWSPRLSGSEMSEEPEEGATQYSADGFSVSAGLCSRQLPAYKMAQQNMGFNKVASNCTALKNSDTHHPHRYTQEGFMLSEDQQVGAQRERPPSSSYCADPVSQAENTRKPA